MPSMSYTVAISAQRRVRVNVCEGEVNVTEEHYDGSKWTAAARGISMDRGQAKRLAETITAGLKNGY